MQLSEGMICKHFKGKDLLEKNIYEILAVNVIYSGDNDLDLSGLVIYKSIFQENKIFAREYEDLVCELTDEQKEMYNQEYRVQELTEEELRQISDEEFIKKKREYIKNKYANKKTI